ncbi:MAG: glutamate--tRNA ligase [Nanoarchaeota archaeon]
MRDLIEKLALANRHKYGKADVNSVLGAVLREGKHGKDDVPKVKVLVESAVLKVNAMDPKDVERLAKDLPQKAPAQKKDLKPLTDAKKGHVVMRLEPSPSGPLHVGHAYGLLINHEYVRRNDGRLIIRISDTNPENIYPPAYALIPEDARWLTGGDVEVVVQSDRMDLYYAVAEKVIVEGFAYVCTCSSEEFKAYSQRLQPCPCRSLDPETHVERWEQMRSDAPMGWAVVRIKTDMAHKNPAMRDWPALRINTTPHPRQASKYRVWPMMNFCVAVDDHDMGMTHVIHGKDHHDNTKRQQYLFDYLHWQVPQRLFWGRINFEDLQVSCSKTRPLIESGLFEGWDDIRIPFIGALRRRGFQPDAFRRWAIEVGVSLNDKTLTSQDFYTMLSAFNKDVVEPTATRLFFIADPVRIKVKGAPRKKVSMRKHPDHPSRGVRHFETASDFFIAQQDVPYLGDGLIRLMDCINFISKDGEYVFKSEDYEEYKVQGRRIIHWLPADGPTVDVEVLMPDHTLVKGFAEQAVQDVKVGDVVQLERFGFCRLDSDDGVYRFWFAHR